MAMAVMFALTEASVALTEAMEVMVILMVAIGGPMEVTAMARGRPRLPQWLRLRPSLAMAMAVMVALTEAMAATVALTEAMEVMAVLTVATGGLTEDTDMASRGQNKERKQTLLKTTLEKKNTT